MIVYDRIGLQECLKHACAYNALIQGPIPLGSSVPIVVSITCIIVPSRDEALSVIWQHVRDTCDESNYPFDETEWLITHLELVNGN